MSLADLITNFFAGLKTNTVGQSNTNDSTALPPTFVVRTSDIQRNPNPVLANNQPKIERDLVKVGELPTMSASEYNKVSAAENLKDNIPNAPDYVAAYTKKYGVPDVGVAKAIYDTAKKFGESPELLFKIANTESKDFDPKSHNAKTGAQGLFQFLPSTWKDVQTRLGGLKNGIKDPYDPAQSAAAAALYVQDIKKTLSKVKPGDKITDQDIYLGHFSGARRASQVLQALQKGKGDQRADTVYKPNEIKNNLPIFYDGYYKTVTNKAGKKVKQFVPTTMKNIKGVYDTITMNTNKEDTKDISMYLPTTSTAEV